MSGNSLLSPNGITSVELVVKDNALYYSICRNGKCRFERSRLGVNVGTKDTEFTDYSNNCIIEKIKRSEIRNRKYTVFGRKEINYENCFFYEVFIECNEIEYILEIKVFDEGVAFRFVFPETAGTYVFGEPTEFLLPNDSKIYASFGCRHPGCNTQLNNEDALCYECTYAEYDPKENMCPNAYVKEKDHIEDADHFNYILMPMAVKYQDGTFGAILESEVFNYLGSSLRPYGNYKFGLNTTAGKKQFKTFKVENSVITPWRVFAIADNLNDLYNNGIVNAVAEKTDKDFSFVEPGRSVWHWHSELMRGNHIDYDMLKKYTDTAAKLGFEYNIIDGGWQRLKQIIGDKEYDSKGIVKLLSEQGKNYGVGQIAWMGFINNELNPNNFNEKGDYLYSVRERLETCCEAGVKGVKVDFFRSESNMYAGVNMYEYILDYCADRKIICDFHGATKPTGLAAKYPNELSREGIRGMENYFYTPMCYPDIAYAFTTLTFVRGLAGHGDWTPFIEDGIGLASVVLTDSPVNAISATCEELLNLQAIDFLKSIPTSFDNTTVLPESEFGKFISMCKEKGGNYFFASINNKNKTVTQRLDLKKYMSKGVYHMEMWFDTPSGIRSENRLLQEKDFVDISIPAYRAFAARFSKLGLNYYGGEVKEPVVIKYFNDEDVYYTLDGTDPTNSATRIAYCAKIDIKESCYLRACSIKDGAVNANIKYRFNVME